MSCQVRINSGFGPRDARMVARWLEGKMIAHQTEKFRLGLDLGYQ